jgi:hypothetical protein
MEDYPSMQRIQTRWLLRRLIVGGQMQISIAQQTVVLLGQAFGNGMGIQLVLLGIPRISPFRHG